ncbi:MAG: AAA family ATPase [Paracholeplasma sp.]|nr:AAA family ATPase [Paracholeplasma sp.]MDY3195938.1 AAA family ATPase [Paracholeplasma sp.]
MKKLILIKGHLATGKTTFKTQLEERFSIPSFDKDTIKETISDVIGFSNREENKRLSRATMAVMFQILKHFMKTNNDLILESNFHKEEFEEIKRQQVLFGYDVLVLDFYSDPSVLYDRFLKRAKQNRHITHLSMDFVDQVGFEDYLSKDDFIIPFNQVIRVDATTFDYQNDPSLLLKIEHFLEKKSR